MSGREEGFLFDLPDPEDVPLSHALKDAYDSENRFRTMVIERLDRIEAILKRLTQNRGAG